MSIWMANNFLKLIQRERGKNEMQKRTIQILFRLNEREADHLYDLVAKSGRSREAFLRAMIEGYQLCERPDREFYKAMLEISAIGNNVNQLAAKANTLGFIDVPKLEEEAKKWHQFQLTVRENFLIPKKDN